MPVKRTRNVSRIIGARRVLSAIEFFIGGNANGREAAERVESVNWKTGKCRERYFFEVAFAISCYFGQYFARNFPLFFHSSNLIYFIRKSRARNSLYSEGKLQSNCGEIVK